MDHKEDRIRAHRQEWEISLARKEVQTRALLLAWVTAHQIDKPYTRPTDKLYRPFLIKSHFFKGSKIHSSFLIILPFRLLQILNASLPSFQPQVSYAFFRLWRLLMEPQELFDKVVVKLP